MEPALRPTLADAAHLFRARDIRFALIGGLAVSIGAGSVPVVLVEDLLVMKALAGRPQDEQDMRGLIAANGDAIDWTRCLALAGRGGLEPARGKR